MACCCRMGRERRVVAVKSWRGVSQEVGSEAGLEKPCKVRAWRNLVGNHQVQGVVNMFQLWNCLNKILDT